MDGGAKVRIDYDAFLRWAYPNPMSNLVRGHLAEYLVGHALACKGALRIEWEPYDLLTADGARIEVKAAGLRQAWESPRPSPPRFGVGPASGSDVHVFALHTGVDNDCDPTDTDEWRFFVLPTDALLSHRSIRLAVLRRIAEEIGWPDLPRQVEQASVSGATSFPVPVTLRGQHAEPPAATHGWGGDHSSQGLTVTFEEALADVVAENGEAIEAMKDR